MYTLVLTFNKRKTLKVFLPKQNFDVLPLEEVKEQLTPQKFFSKKILKIKRIKPWRKIFSRIFFKPSKYVSFSRRVPTFMSKLFFKNIFKYKYKLFLYLKNNLQIKLKLFFKAVNKILRPYINILFKVLKIKKRTNNLHKSPSSFLKEFFFYLLIIKLHKIIFFYKIIL